MRQFLQRLRTSFLLLALAAVCLPQTSTEVVRSDVRTVGERLACKCGACSNNVGNCPMLGCGYSTPAREKIGTMLDQGKSEDEIVNSFIQEMGIVALAQPPREGFNRIGYWMPFFVVAFGLGMIALYIKRFRKPAPVPEINVDDPRIRDRYRERIEKEMADLD